MMLTAMLLAATAGGFPYAPRQAANARCRMSVAGKRYIDGPCVYRPMVGGSFVFDDDKTRAFCRHAHDDCAMADYDITHDGYFGMIEVTAPNVADGYWNEGEGLHAQSPLGRLHRHGACWTGGAGRPPVEVCVWR